MQLLRDKPPTSQQIAQHIKNSDRKQIWLLVTPVQAKGQPMAV